MFQRITVVTFANRAVMDQKLNIATVHEIIS